MGIGFGKWAVTQAIKKTPRKYKVAPDITKVAPTVSKELSTSAQGRQLSGWAKRMQQKLRDQRETLKRKSKKD